MRKWKPMVFPALISCRSVSSRSLFCHLRRIIHRYFDIGRGSVNVDFKSVSGPGTFLILQMDCVSVTS
ncbi:MAG: hypothetical protein ACLVJO_02290 [[Clostridium] scindens]